MTRREWEEWKEYNHNDIGALKDFAAYDNDLECLNDIISSDEVDDFIKERLKNGGWRGVACCLCDIIDYMIDDWYEIDGYANLKPCPNWETLISYVEEEIRFDLPTCDNCGEEFDDSELKSLDEWVSGLNLTKEEIEKIRKDYGDLELICKDCFKEIIEEVAEELTN